MSARRKRCLALVVSGRFSRSWENQSNDLHPQLTRSKNLTEGVKDHGWPTHENIDCVIGIVPERVQERTTTKDEDTKMVPNGFLIEPNGLCGFHVYDARNGLKREPEWIGNFATFAIAIRVAKRRLARKGESL